MRHPPHPIEESAPDFREERCLLYARPMYLLRLHRLPLVAGHSMKTHYCSAGNDEEFFNPDDYKKTIDHHVGRASYHGGIAVGNQSRAEARYGVQIPLPISVEDMRVEA